MLNLAAGAVEELSKDSPSGEIVEYKTKDFVKTVEVCNNNTMMLLCTSKQSPTVPCLDSVNARRQETCMYIPICTCMSSLVRNKLCTSIVQVCMDKVTRRLSQERLAN